VHVKKEMHSRDTAVLIDLLWFNVVHYSSLFQYCFSIYYGPYSSWNLVYLFVNFFVNTIVMIMIEIQVDPGEFKGFHNPPLPVTDP